MFNCTRIASIEYYVALKHQADSDTQAIVRSHRDRIAYYADDGAGESDGIWWTPTPAFSITDPTSPLSLSVNGTIVNESVVRDLAAGRHPITKSAIIQVTREARVVGYDVQISAPKSFSLLVAFSPESRRRALLNAHDRAFSVAMQWAFDQGLIVSRRGKGGARSEPVAACTAAVYRHLTSRAGDPQVHSHGILMNSCLRADQSSGTLDNFKLLKYGGAIAAVYRGELARILREVHDVRCVRRGRNIEIAGIPDSVVANFSKRRAMIENAAVAVGVNTAKNRTAAQILSYETRPSKNTVPSAAVLQVRWERELGNLGWNESALWLGVEAASRSGTADDDQADQALALASSALEELSKDQSVFEGRIAIRYIAESVQTISSGPETIVDIFNKLQRNGLLVKISENSDETLYSTRRTVDMERSMLRSAAARRNRTRLFTAEMIEDALTSFPTLRTEQRDAVRHALNRDSISVVQGTAGSGKSASMAVVTQLAQGDAWTIAPSWKAVDAIRNATKVASEMARAVQGFVRRLESGQITLTERTVVIVDEASMVNTADMAALIRHTQMAGKLILVGDVSQLSAVTAGAPMAALARLLGSFRLNEVQRQSVPWQRSATTDFATGDPMRAMEAYDKAGAIAWKTTRGETLDALVADYVSDRLAQPTQSQIVIASWHVDVVELNRLIREASLRQNWITSTHYRVLAYPRYGDVAVQLDLAIGDVLIFGESIEIDGLLIRNGDTGTLVDVQGDSAHPIATIALANGKSLVSTFSRLVGFRRDDEEAAPKLQHAYAVTCHSAQGVTFDKSYVAYLRGMGKESIYVAMTRHRNSVNLYVDQDRLKRLYGARAAKHIRTDRIGLDLPENDWPHSDLATVDPKAAFFREICRVERKANVSDFVPQLDSWISHSESPRPTATILPFVRKSSFFGANIKLRMKNRMRAPPYQPPARIKIKLESDAHKAREELDSFLRPQLAPRIRRARASFNFVDTGKSHNAVLRVIEEFLASFRRFTTKLLGGKGKGWMELSPENQIARQQSLYVSVKDKTELAYLARKSLAREDGAAIPKARLTHKQLPQNRPKFPRPR